VVRSILRASNKRATRFTFPVAVALTAVALGSTQAAYGSQRADQSGQGPYLTISACCSFGSYSYNQFNPNAFGPSQNWVLLPLADEDYPSLSSFTPVLASSWSVQGRQLAIHIRSGVNWQDGQPVTSTDLYDTAVLDGTDDTPFWNDITDVIAPSPSEVVFTLRPSEAPALAEDDIFNNLYPVPASVYGRFVTPALKSEVVAYFAKDDTDPTAAAAMPQAKAIGKVFNNLASYNVPSLMGDGPFELKNVTTAEALLVKWDGFYDASAVHVAGVDYYCEANQAVYPLLTSGVLQFTSVELPPSILSRWRTTPGANMFTHPTAGLVIAFNDSEYPYNEVQVRQALAYLVPRNTMADDAYGTQADAAGAVETTPDGLPGYLQDQYLTPAQVAQLNPYPVNDAKATSLLESVGFHKSSGQWVTAHGQPFTLTLYAESGASDVQTAYEAAADALTAFGVKTSVEDVAQATLTGDELDGDFAAGFSEPNAVNPLSVFDQMLGPSSNFPTLGSYAGDKGIGFGPSAKVPGLGTVNVSQTIANEVATVAPGAAMDQLVWDWARLVNEQVPYLWYATKVYQLSYSTKQFTDWPAQDSPLWQIMAANRDAGLVLAISEGFVRPRG
jgi:peptide/nickel transport system substrate-binding protein